MPIGKLKCFDWAVAAAAVLPLEPPKAFPSPITELLHNGQHYLCRGRMIVTRFLVREFQYLHNNAEIRVGR